MHTYVENDLYPASSQVIDDSDPPNATNTNTAPETALDRLHFLSSRLMPGGIAAATITNLAGLTALTGMVDKDTRHVPGFGRYIFRTTANSPGGVPHNTQDGFAVVPGSGTPAGQWFQESYLLRFVREIQQSVASTALGSPLNLGSSTKNAPDPAGRIGGTVGLLIVSSANFTIKQDDLFHVNWSMPFGISTSVVSTTDSDICAGMMLKDSITAGFSIPTEYAPLLDASGSQGLSPLFLYRAAASIGGRWSMTRGGLFVAAASQTNPCAFTLVAAENANVHAFILADSMISVTQYRVIL